jgi:hypothetical protein
MTDQLLDFLGETPNDIIERLCLHYGCDVITDYANEVILRIHVAKLIQLLSPSHNFYLNGQRQVDLERVGNLYKEQTHDFMTTKTFSIINAPIVLGHCHSKMTPDNPYGLAIVDGQHRLDVIKELYGDEKYRQDLQQVLCLVRIKKASTESELQQFFVTINKNWEPVPQYHLDVRMGFVIDGVLDMLRKNYPAHITTANVQRPQINLVSLKAQLSKSDKLREIINENENAEQCLSIVLNTIKTGFSRVHEIS